METDLDILELDTAYSEIEDAKSQITELFDYDDDDTDSVKITIDDHLLSKITNEHMKFATPINKQTNYPFSSDVGINSEVQILTKRLFYEKTTDDPVIVIIAEETPIPITFNIELSTRLREHVWGAELFYEKQFV